MEDPIPDKSNDDKAGKKKPFSLELKSSGLETGGSPGSSDSPDSPAAIDPVCNMQVVPARARGGSYEHDGETYYFCNPRCKDLFKANPGNYLEEKKKEEPAGDLKTFYLSESAFDYTCPMDPEVRQKTPGACPKCGMALMPSIAISEGEQVDSDELRALRVRLLLAIPLTLTLIALNMPEMLAMHGQATSTLQGGNGIAGFADSVWMPLLQLALASPVVLWGAAPIFQKAWRAAREKQMNMFTLIAFGVAVSYLVSLINLALPAAVQATLGHMLYFESAAGIVTLVLVGQILELKARTSSGNALESLFALAPKTARREKPGQTDEEILVFAIKKGDRLRVLPGDQVPADGVILTGTASLDESVLTGNSLPSSKTEGERVFAGTINMDGNLLIQADSLGRDTVFAQIVDLLARAQSSRSPMQEIADGVAAIFIPSVIAIGILTFTAWLTFAGMAAMHHAIQNLVAVLVIACPCALGLATPMAVSNAVARASRLGLLVKDARALEMLAGASDILIDKTGTLTRGKFELVEIATASSASEEESLLLAASLEQGSKHPLALAICQEAQSRGIGLHQPAEVKYLPGMGIRGNVNGKTVLVGSEKFLNENGVATGGSNAVSSPATPDHALSSVFMSVDSSLKARFSLGDKLKDEAQEFISQLRELSVRPRILSGDGKSSVTGAAADLGIPEQDLRWSLMPQNKVEEIRSLQEQNRKVAMLGDGVNDAAALGAADAGIAMASGSDVAISSAPISVMHSDLLSVTNGIKLARLMTATMKENLFLAFIYNVLALLLATGILYPSTGIELNPAIAAAAMSLSSLSVILNSSKIKNARL